MHFREHSSSSSYGLLTDSFDIGVLRDDSNPVAQARAAHTPPLLLASMVQSVSEGINLAPLHVNKYILNKTRKAAFAQTSDIFEVFQQRSKFS
jgi:hypothetical protein